MLNINLEEYVLDDVVSHCKNVAVLSEYVAQQLNLSKEYTNLLVGASLVHDIGKHYVSPEILYSRRGLTFVEREVIDLHSLWGYEILSQSGVDKVVCQLVLLHHGLHKPMPKGLNLLHIAIVLYPVLMACDVYDAMISKRSYKEACNHKQAIDALKQYPEIPNSVINILNNKVLRVCC